MATEELGNLEIVEETPPTTPTEQEPQEKDLVHTIWTKPPNL